jgi:hypothetical protein
MRPRYGAAFINWRSHTAILIQAQNATSSTSWLVHLLYPLLHWPAEQSEGAVVSRADFKLVKNVPINDILLDVENARIRAGADQADCVARILRKEDQLVALAEDIFANGLTTMPILVSPLDKKWVVKDGNRRIAALKLLNDPARWTQDSRVQARFQAIRDIDPSQVPTSVDVLWSSDEGAITRELLARHSGAMGGAGQLDWSAYLRTVYLVAHKHTAEYKRPAQYALWAERHGVALSDEFPITSLQRFFSETNLARLGFDVGPDDDLNPNMNIDTIKRLATTLLQDFDLARKKVEDVFTAEKATQYITDLRRMHGLTEPSPPTPQPAPAPGPGTPAPSPTAAPGTPAPGPGGGGGASAAPPAPTRAPATPKTAPAERKRIFGSGAPGIAVPAQEKKAQTIVAELRLMNLDDTPFAASMLLRALLEISDEYYRKKQGMQDKKVLAKNVAASADSMLQKSLLTQPEHDMVKRLTGGPDTLLQIETLQKMLHRDTHHSSKQFVNTMWDNVGCFVRACWR